MILTKWLYQIIGIAAIGLLVDVIMPAGNMPKYIRKVFGIIVLMIMISPIVALSEGKFEINELIYGQDISADEGYIQTVEDSRKHLSEKYIGELLSEEGLDADVTVIYGDVETSLYVDFKNNVLIEEDRHIYITEKILQIADEVLGIDEEQITIVW